MTFHLGESSDSSADFDPIFDVPDLFDDNSYLSRSKTSSGILKRFAIDDFLTPVHPISTIEPDNFESHAKAVSMGSETSSGYLKRLDVDDVLTPEPISTIEPAIFKSHAEVVSNGFKTPSGYSKRYATDDILTPEPISIIEPDKCTNQAKVVSKGAKTASGYLKRYAIDDTLTLPKPITTIEPAISKSHAKVHAKGSKTSGYLKRVRVDEIATPEPISSIKPVNNYESYAKVHSKGSQPSRYPERLGIDEEATPEPPVSSVKPDNLDESRALVLSSNGLETRSRRRRRVMRSEIINVSYASFKAVKLPGGRVVYEMETHQEETVKSQNGEDDGLKKHELLEGWEVETRRRQNGRTGDKVYYHPKPNKQFRSAAEVKRFLAMNIDPQEVDEDLMMRRNNNKEIIIYPKADEEDENMKIIDEHLNSERRKRRNGEEVSPIAIVDHKHKEYVELFMARAYENQLNLHGRIRN